jgi:predicted metal-dependent phosphoesterase TrpH
MLKGAIHIHSTYSDGEFTLGELRRVLLAAGCSFVCMTDHAEFFDYEKLEAYTRECESLSDDRFRFVAGLEYACDGRMHVLGLGVTSHVASTNPQSVIRHIEDRAGVSVIAHPIRSSRSRRCRVESKRGTQNTMAATRRDRRRFACSGGFKSAGRICEPFTE